MAPQKHTHRVPSNQYKLHGVMSCKQISNAKLLSAAQYEPFTNSTKQPKNMTRLQ